MSRMGIVLIRFHPNSAHCFFLSRRRFPPSFSLENHLKQPLLALEKIETALLDEAVREIALLDEAVLRELDHVPYRITKNP